MPIFLIPLLEIMSMVFCTFDLNDKKKISQEIENKICAKGTFFSSTLGRS